MCVFDNCKLAFSVIRSGFFIMFWLLSLFCSHSLRLDLTFFVSGSGFFVSSSGFFGENRLATLWSSCPKLPPLDPSLNLTLIFVVCFYRPAFCSVAKSVCNPVIPPAPMPCKTFCFVCFYRPAFCRACVFILWTPCLVTNKKKKN